MLNEEITRVFQSGEFRGYVKGVIVLIIKHFMSRLFSKRITEQNASKGQIELLRFMKYISEEYMCASWMYDLDESLHDALYRKTGCSSFFLRDPITREDFDKLRKLHLAVNGWWRYMDEKVFLKLGEWHPAREGSTEPLKYEDLRNNFWSHKEYGT